jgi:hypothetical protein
MKLKLNATCIYHQNCLQLHYIEHQKTELKTYSDSHIF